MKRCVLCGGAVAALFLAVSLACSQSSVAPPDPLASPPLAGSDANAPAVNLAGVPRKETQPKTIDEVLRRLVVLKAQKAELDKQEKEMVALLAEKLEEQRQLIRKLGINPDGNDTSPATPGAVTGAAIGLIR